MRTQVRPIVLVLAASILSGCGGDSSSPRAEDSALASGDIAYAVNRDGWNEIWVMDESGDNRRRLTETQPRGVDAAGNQSPTWSPQGDRIAFVGSGDAADADENRHELYVMDDGGGDAEQLTKNEALDGDPSWSPDGKRIVFVRADFWGTDQVVTSLRVIDADGSDEETLLQEQPLMFLSAPAWSPDGERIAFSRASFSGQQLELTLHVMRSDGSGLRQIADQAGQPAWSPDGKRIAFVKIVDALGELRVSDADGKNARRLIKRTLDAAAPAWSPDGKQIVFSANPSNTEEGTELYVVTSTGGTPKRLTRNEVSDVDPDWR